MKIIHLLSKFKKISTPAYTFDTYTTTEEVKKLLKEVNAKKASGFDKIPPKLVKLAAGVLAAPLSKTINNSISKGVFPNEAKIALVSPLDKKTPDKNSVLNYRPVSILPTFSKIFGKVIKNYLMKSMDNFFSPYLSAYRASYSTQHVLLRLIEEWKTNLDNNFAVGAVLMDLSKAFDCIPHDLLIAKLAAYGFEEKTLLYIYSYLENRKQCVKINNINSNFQTIKSGVPQGSIVGPILFNIFFKDFFFFLCNLSVHNFSDDTNLSSFVKGRKKSCKHFGIRKWLCHKLVQR